MSADTRITAQHVSLYLTLFDCWNDNRFRNPFVLVRSEIMYLSRIGSVNTYTRCLKDLTEWGYISYRPSFNPAQGSKVFLYRLDDGIPTGINIGQHYQNATAGVTATGTAGDTINKTNTNNTKRINSFANGPSNESSNFVNDGNPNPLTQTTDPRLPNHGTEKKEASGGRAGAGAAAQGATSRGPESLGVPSSLDEAKEYFIKVGSTALEAETFFSHYKAVGWQIGATPVRHWQALADKWLIKSAALTPTKVKSKHPAGRLHVDNNKNYAEPL